MKTIKISGPDDVARLPWRGNYAADAHLFDAVSRYVENEPDPLKAYQAERHASQLGMGEPLPEEPSAEDLDWIRSRFVGARK